MLYQLVEYNSLTSNFVAQSPDLATEGAATTWFNMSIFGKQLTPGFQWGMIPANHPSYTVSPTAPTVRHEPTFEEIMVVQKAVWQKEQKEKAEDEAHFAEYLRKYRRSM